jgi:serine/threonine-protein kinase
MTSEEKAASTPFEHMEGKYEILEKMREGGMGAVYKVRHRLLDEIRVIKMMRPHLARDEVLRARFVREAKTAIRLRHANLAQLYDFTVDEEGNAFIVMEYVSGPTLVEMAKVLPHPDLGLALEITHQALDVIGYLHRRGVIHRDISPDNMILSQDDELGPQIKLIDLGIAKDAQGDDRLTTAGTFLGKVRYSSPEHFKGQEGVEVDIRSDLYSLGIVIYELLTGVYPIKGTNTASIMAGHLIEPPMSFKKSDPDGIVPKDMQEIVLKVLAKDPEERFKDAAELSAAIEPIRAQTPVSPECLQLIFDLPLEATVKIAVPPKGATQKVLDRQFALEETRPPATAEIEQATVIHKEDTGASRAAARTEKQVKTLLMGAGKLLATRHYGEAAVQVNTALGLDPDNAEAKGLLTDINDAEKQLQADRQSAAREIADHLSRGYLSLASEAMASATDRLGRDEELERLHQEIMAAEKQQREHEESKQQLLASGERALQVDDIAAAVDALSEALKLDPGDAGLKKKLRTAEKALRKQQKEQRRAQEIASTVAAISGNLDRKEYAEAQRSIEVAEKLYGKEEPFAVLRQRLEERLDQECQNQADKLRHEASELVEQQEFDKAIDLLHEALALVPQHMKTMRALAAVKKAQAEYEEELRRAEALAREIEGVERLIAAGRFKSAHRRIDELEQEHDPLERATELRATIESEVSQQQERKSLAFGFIEQARAAAEKDDFREAGKLLDKARIYSSELLEVKSLIDETESLVQRRSDKQRRLREIAKACESISQRLAEEALDDAEHELELAERLYGKNDDIGELRQQVDRLRLQQRQARVEQLLIEAATSQDSFSAIIEKLEEAQSLDPENEKVQRLLAETRAACNRYQQEQRQQAIAEVMAEVDKLILAGDLQEALRRTKQAVTELGEFKEARTVRFNLERTLED